MTNNTNNVDSHHVYPKCTHVIFDMDGLLLDTERIYTEVMERVAKEHGGVYNWDIKVQLMGRPGRQGLF